MITLNLLPPQEKTEIERRKNLSRVLKWGSLGFIFILAFLVLLSSVWIFLLVQLGSAESIYEKLQANPQSKAFQDFQNEIGQLNKKMKDLDRLGGQIFKYSPPLKALSELTAPGIKFTNISISQKNIVLEGQAQNRDLLLSFQDALAKSAYFEKLDAPISNLFKQENIDFSFNFWFKQ